MSSSGWRAGAGGLGAGRRLLASAAAGLAVGVAAGLLHAGSVAVLLGWATAAALFTSSVWLTVLPQDAVATRQHALREDPARPVADVVLVCAAVASLIAVGLVLVHAGDARGRDKAVDVAVALSSVIVSWASVHTIFMLQHARAYYRPPEGGIDFGQDEPPQYRDFAYVSFTLGMTFQVSDTSLLNTPTRMLALRQALLSYLFGTVIIAVTINLVAGLTG